MGKETAKRAGLAATEAALRSLMPELVSAPRSLEERIGRLETRLDLRLDDLKEYVDSKFDQQREIINELGIKINTVATRLEDYTEFTKINSRQMSEWPERLVRVEEIARGAPARRRRAG